jgi:Phospholipase_D-nuclease N-terminal
MGRLLPLLALLDLALLVVALIDCLSTEGEIRALPRIAWVFIILLFPPVGPIAWFVAGRPARVAVPSDPLFASPPHRVLAPDDDPDFLRQVDTRKRDEEEEMLRLWEADLRRREDDLRKREQQDEDPS